MVTRRRALTLFRDACVTLDIAASSTLTWRIPHQILSTGELGIELSQKLSAIALSDGQVQMDKVVYWLPARRVEILAQGSGTPGPSGCLTLPVDGQGGFRRRILKFDQVARHSTSAQERKVATLFPSSHPIQHGQQTSRFSS